MRPVADNAVITLLEDVRNRIVIDGEHQARALNADRVIKFSADANGDIEAW